MIFSRFDAFSVNYPYYQQKKTQKKLLKNLHIVKCCITFALSNKQ